MSDLNFTGVYSPPAPDKADLAFGDSGGGGVVENASAVVQISLRAPILKAEAAYDSSTSRPFVSDKALAWEQEARKLKNSPVAPWGVTEKAKIERSINWDSAFPLKRDVEALSSILGKVSLASVLKWEVASPKYGLNSRIVQKGIYPDNRLFNILWEVAVRSNSNHLESYKNLLRKNQALNILWAEAIQKNRFITVLWALAKRRELSPFKDIPWDIARKVFSGKEPEPPPPIIPPYAPDYNLNFHCKFVNPNPLNVILNFGKDECGGGSGLKDQEVYFIVNNVILKRLEDGVEIETISASIGIDSSSWCWSFSATIAYTEFAKIEPTEKGPVEVELEINGIKWRLLVEKYSTKEVLAKTDINISGRSLNAYLESPYAPVRSLIQDVAINSRQFAENELTRAGLVTGFDLNWQLVDSLGWLMPANTWSYTNLSPMQVITAIAGGAGGYVNVNPLANEILVLPEYPAPFWEWDGITPDKLLPESLIKARSLTWEEKPLYNGVYASGEHTGVTAFIKRAGTAGDFQAPMYINPMISHSSAARQKGMSILSAGGKQAKVGIDVPMEKSLGLVQPGMMIEIQRDGAKKWRGLVRSTQISANFSSNGGLVVNQAIDIERHYGGF